MIIEKWERWEPIEGLLPKYDIESIIDSLEGFTIMLTDIKNSKVKVRVFFENSVDAYRNTDESFRVATIHDLDENYRGDFYVDWTFFKVTNSSYLHWLSEQSFTFSDSLPFIHFSFIDDDSILDVINCSEPKVELITIL